MGRMIKPDHIAFAVEDVEKVLEFFKKYFPVEMGTARTPGYDGQFNLADFKIGNLKIELLEDGGHNSFVKKFLDKRGESFHHLTFHVDDLDALAARLEKDGLQVVGKWSAGEWKTAFIHPKSAFGILIQFWQTPEDKNT